MSDSKVTMAVEQLNFLNIFGEEQELISEAFPSLDRIVVFGYGSILWKQGFEYHSKWKGFVRGYERRFWQRNVTHRGTSEKV